MALRRAIGVLAVWHLRYAPVPNSLEACSSRESPATPHRVALSNQRLVRLEGEEVTFTWKDYAQGQRLREMTLSGEEFLRRFLLHVLPDRFVRIRCYGLLANRHREQALALCREVLPGPPAPPKLTKSDWQSLLQSLTGVDPRTCEVCGQNALRLVEELAPQSAPQKETRAPPQ